MHVIDGRCKAEILRKGEPATVEVYIIYSIMSLIITLMKSLCLYLHDIILFVCYTTTCPASVNTHLEFIGVDTPKRV